MPLPAPTIIATRTPACVRCARSWSRRRNHRCAATPARARTSTRCSTCAPIFQQGHRELAIETLPALLRPRKGRYGLIDYEKVFCPDTKNGPDIFDLRGIDRAQGALVVVRPDQYIAHVLPLDAHEALAEFFAGFMLPA